MLHRLGQQEGDVRTSHIMYTAIMAVTLFEWVTKARQRGMVIGSRV